MDLGFRMRVDMAFGMRWIVGLGDGGLWVWDAVDLGVWEAVDMAFGRRWEYISDDFFYCPITPMNLYIFFCFIYGFMFFVFVIVSILLH